jgi:succinate dehydrogenase/fumarate reductase flavoprotein subunit
MFGQGLSKGDTMTEEKRETKKWKPSRREFLVGSTFAGAGIATAVLTGCNSSAPTPSGDVGADSIGEKPLINNEILSLDSKVMTTGTWSWSTAPADIPADQIVDTIDCDVLVIGSGLAGCCAALSAIEKGVKTIIIEKSTEGTIAGRGLDIAAFHTKYQQELVSQRLLVEPDYRQAVRDWIKWAQGRVKEPLLWVWSKKSGATFDWMYDKVIERGLSCYIWDGYYKGPDYTELAVTHAFYLTDTEEQTFGVSDMTAPPTYGNAVLVPVLYDLVAEAGGEIHYSMPCVRLIRDDNGPCTGVIAGLDGAYTQYNAARGIVIATGDYSGDTEMVQCYAPFQNYSTDVFFYMPPGVNTGDLHKQVLWIGGAMQKSEPHASTTHLDPGATSYGFLHVNGEGNRFKNEDVNTQSKSIVKALQPTKKAFTIYDSNGLKAVKEQIDNGLGGGLQWGQLTHPVGRKYNLEAQEQVLRGEVERGLTFQSDTLEGLAEQMGCNPAVFKTNVERYNELCATGNDVDFGKRAEILVPVETPPFYAGQLVAGLLTMNGGIRTDVQCRVLDIDDKPIERLYVAGSAAGDFFGAGDYPTSVSGINHGRCVTFGRMAGINAAGGDAEKEIPSIEM